MCDDEIVTDVLRRGADIMQRDLGEFDENLATYLGLKHAIGTAALVFALQAAGVGPGDEVIASSRTFLATAAAHHLGALLVVYNCLPD